MRGHIPFDRDIEKNGAYIYAGKDAPLSAVVANLAQSRLIHNFINERHVNVLDVGCGDGTYTAELLGKLRVSNVLGIDPASNAIDTAQKRYQSVSGLTFSVTTPQELAAVGRKFDLAIVRGVLHHSEDPEELLKQLGAIVDEIIVLEPNGLNLVLKVIEKTSKYHKEHGERSFSFWKIENWLNNAGFLLARKNTGVLVPFFAPNKLVVLLSRVQPLAERLSFLRWFVCGAQVFYAKKSEPASA